MVMGRACVIGCRALCPIEKFTVSPPKVSMSDTDAVPLIQHVIIHEWRYELGKTKKSAVSGAFIKIVRTQMDAPLPPVRQHII